jgi:hypothetical protein
VRGLIYAYAISLTHFDSRRFFEHNPGIPSRVPHTLYFEDYTDHELMHMFEAYIRKKYTGSMKLEDGIRGLYARVAIRRLGRGRGRPGFGNARAMQNMYMHIAERQAVRVERERKARATVDDLLFTMEDLIGPDPSIAIAQSKAWAKLREMIGLGTVKMAVEDLVGIIGTNYQRELKEEAPLEMSLNRCLLGLPLNSLFSLPTLTVGKLRQPRNWKDDSREALWADPRGYRFAQQRRR